jgi:RNA polymerase sigma-70 factor (ECF subfamily)
MPDPATFEMAELLKSVANSDLDAFRRLYDLYLQKVYSYSYFLTRSSEQAEDLTQELFAKIWIKRTELRSLENFDAWLTTLVRNSAYNFLKRHAIEQKALRRIELSKQPDSVSIDDALIHKEYSKIYQEAIDQLPPQQKKVFLLSRNEGLKQEEIASNLGISLNTVKNHMKAALFSIRTYMKSYVSSLLVWLLLKFLS